MRLQFSHRHVHVHVILIIITPVRLIPQRIQREFFHQGDLEKAGGHVPGPFMDRAGANIPKSQLGFIKFVIRVCVRAWVTGVWKEEVKGWGVVDQ